jgi:hypothetical protein
MSEALKQEYDNLIKSGFAWEFLPELTGDWMRDKLHFEMFKDKTMIDAQNVFPDVTRRADTSPLIGQCPDCKMPYGSCYCNRTLIPPTTVQPKPDMINHPPHYVGQKFECIEVIEDVTRELTGIEAVCTASVVKYIWRWKKKEDPIKDLKKTRWYLDRLIKKLEDESKGHE